MVSIRVATLGASIALFPGASVAVTLSTGTANTSYVITITGLNVDSGGCRPFDVGSKIEGPTTQGSGTASGSAVIPSVTCTGADDAWQLVRPQFSAEGAAGLESPLDPSSTDSGSMFAWSFGVFTLVGTVDEPQLVTITVEGTHSASGGTEEFQFKSNDELAFFLSHVNSQAHIIITADAGPNVPSLFQFLWNFQSSCEASNHAGRVDECSYAVDAPLDQTIEFPLQPGYQYRIGLDLNESLRVGAGIFPMPEPGTLALLGLGLLGLGVTRRGAN